ncbi:WecB/TagA/CpsF family glycosyltransferase [Methylobacter sp. sgz302048]|uniref:WecB/TagA/CpsF family glycosyltransferase n=1 Tax=Methylobacter sp. sgz302048 TaxID=3455945 RepID=UPI003FA032A8
MDAFYRQSWCLCGLPFDAVNASSAISVLKLAIKEDRPFFLSTPNLNFLIAAQTDKAFQESVINSDLSVADGMPLIWMSRLLNIPIPERVAGSDLIEALFAEKNTPPIRVFFFGGEPGVGEKACQIINQANAGLQAVGHYCPGFGSIEGMSTSDIIDEINRHEIDFLIVSLGAKKGQAWIERNRHQLKAPVISHLGAVINFFAGTVKRAPVWMQRVGLEWLWRILEEPLLWKRYFFDGLRFAKLLSNNVIPYAIWIRLNQRKLNESKPVVINTEEDGHTIKIYLIGTCIDKTIAALRPVFKACVSKKKNVTIDLQAVPTIDGAFLGLCLLLYKHLNQQECQLNFQNINQQNIRIFKWNSAQYLIPQL